MMSITLKLPTHLAKQLDHEAAELDKPLNEYIVELIQHARKPFHQKFHSTSEILAYWKTEGVLGTRPQKTDSQKLARKLRSQVSSRKR